MNRLFAGLLTLLVAVIAFGDMQALGHIMQDPNKFAKLEKSILFASLGVTSVWV